MTPERDLLEAARLIDEMACAAMERCEGEGAALYALARRLRQHARDARQVRDLQHH